MEYPTTICVDGVEYVTKSSVQPEPNGSIKICILQRGWVMVGYFSKDGSQCTLTKPAVIRQWGTTKGLGEIACNGPTIKTVLDKCPKTEFHELTVIAMIDCMDDKWQSHL